MIEDRLLGLAMLHIHRNDNTEPVCKGCGSAKKMGYNPIPLMNSESDQKVELDRQ